VDTKNTTGASIDGVIGVNSGAAVQDLDYFTFAGKEGDVVTLDIDGGIGGARSVDTILGLFGPAPTYQLLMTNDDSTLDPGSVAVSMTGTTTRDSAIVNFRLRLNRPSCQAGPSSFCPGRSTPRS
jgi:hypothetical protein